ncbi:MAG: NAD(P)/FAD-dependent oxidoreductase [Myxococcota bacterium]
MDRHETDYLVIGSGAVGMAFVDTLITESDATVTMVDDHPLPGGHWNDAYPFVRLHQPSHFYGVASTPLGSGRIDEAGSNAGFFELASGPEILSYFEQVMRERLLPSGQVRYFPMCRYDGEGRFHSLVGDDRYEVGVRRRVVDTTYFKTSVPSRHTRNFAVADDVVCLPPNDLPRRASEHARFCVIGAGKTAMDALVWLLEHGASPERLHWVCPRSSWLINREVTQADALFFEESVGGFAAQTEAVANAESIPDLFDRMEACGFLLRIDPTKRPGMFHYATISRNEVEQLRRVDRVIDKGRVARVDPSGLTLQDGSHFPLSADTLYIDCTASAVDFKSNATHPVFEDGRITIQALQVPNPCLSAAATAYIEVHYDDDTERNRLARPVPLPDDESEFPASMLGNMLNRGVWTREPALIEWVTRCRLDPFGGLVQGADRSDPRQAAILDRMAANLMPAIGRLQALIAEGEATR